MNKEEILNILGIVGIILIVMAAGYIGLIDLSKETAIINAKCNQTNETIFIGSNHIEFVDCGTWNAHNMTMV